MVAKKIGGAPAGITVNSGNVAMQAVSSNNTIASSNPLTLNNAKFIRFQQFPKDHSAQYQGPNPIPENTNFRKMVENGISRYRPDLLAAINFEPAYYDPNEPAAGSATSQLLLSDQATRNFTRRLFDSGMTPAGKMLQVQMWAQDLVAQNIAELIALLKTYDELADSVAKRETQLFRAIRKTGKDVGFLMSLLIELEQLRGVLDLKRSLARSTSATLKSALGSKGERALGTAPWNPKRVMSEFLGFAGDNFEAFSNTKVLMQCVFDLQQVIRRSSYKLFGLSIPARKNDRDPFTINRVIDTSAGLRGFEIESFGSPSLSIDATQRKVYNRFLTSLPSDDNDRVKVLLSSLSKEFRVSIGLGDSSVISSLGAKYPNVSDAGDPFPSIMGGIGNTVTDVISAPDQSLAAVTQFQAGGNTVLPFESRYISTDDLSNDDLASEGGVPGLFVPGASYFVDPIINGSPTSFDTTALGEYSKRLGSNIESARNALGNLLQIDALAPSLGRVKTAIVSQRVITLSLYALYAFQIKQYTPGLTYPPVPEGDLFSPTPVIELNEIGLFMTALISDAANDRVLSHMLFRYAMVAGLAAETQGAARGSFFADLVESGELGLTPQQSADELNRITEQIASRVIANRNPRRAVSTTAGPVLQAGLTGAPLGQIDPYQPPAFESFETSKAAMRWTLAAMGLSATEQLDGFRNTWLHAFNQLLRNFNNTLESKNGKINNRTRYGSLSLSTWGMMVFQYIVSFFGKHTPVFFAKSDADDNVRVVVDMEKMDSSFNVMAKVFAELSSNSSLSQTTNIKDTGFDQSKYLELKSLGRRVIEEDVTIIYIMNMLRELNASVRSRSRSVLETFAAGGTNEKKFLEMQEDVDGEELQIDQGQIILALASISDVIGRSRSSSGAKSGGGETDRRGRKKRRSRSPRGSRHSLVAVDVFLDEDILSAGMKNALYSMLRESLYTGHTGRDLRILTIGIPSGFSSNLKRVFDVRKPTDFTAADKQDDVISVNVYKRDEQHDGLVFKPKRFLFELTRFASRTADIPVREDARFSTVLDAMLFRDFSTELRSDSIEYECTGAELLVDESYTFLTLDDVAEIRRNHATSVLLEAYMRFMTGLTLNEKVFASNAQELVDKRAASSGFLRGAANVHLSRTAGVTVVADDVAGGDIFDADTVILQSCDDFDRVAALIESDTIDRPLKTQMTEDLKTFAKLFTSRTTLSDGSLERARLLAPKYFERVFNVPVVASDFVIDEEASDAAQIDSLTKQGLIETSPDPDDPKRVVLRLVRRTPDEGHVSFEKYFIDVETVDNSKRVRDVPKAKATPKKKPFKPKADGKKGRIGKKRRKRNDRFKF